MNKEGAAMTFPLFNLKGRKALITGSSQGIGYALAKGLAEHGATVIVNGRDAAKVGAAVGALEQDGHSVQGALFDVTDRYAVKVSVTGSNRTAPSGADAQIFPCPSTSIVTAPPIGVMSEGVW